MAKMLGDLTDKEIRSMIKNYDAAGKVTGGNWSRAALVLELDRRKPFTIYPPKDFARTILQMCHDAADKRVAYSELWLAYNEGPLPKGQSWSKPITNALAVLGAWCVDNDLPILSTLVVNNTTRELKDVACENVWNYIKAIKTDTSPSAREFVDEQAKFAMDLPMSAIIRKSGDRPDFAAV